VDPANSSPSAATWVDDYTLRIDQFD